MQTNKPHKGTITNWGIWPVKQGLGYAIVGLSAGHPQFDGKEIKTSYVVSRNGQEIETLNSSYTLLAPVSPQTVAALELIERENKPLTIAEAASRAASPAFAIGAHAAPHTFVDVVFDGFPNPDGPRFIELENEVGHSISYGQWIKRADGQHVLRIPLK